MNKARIVAVAFACLVGSVSAYELRFVADAFPPFSYAGADNRAAGPVAEVVRAVCRRLGARCTIEVHPLPRASAMVEAGEVNAIFALPLNAENEEKFLLSEAVIDSATSLFAPAGSRFAYREAKDLDGCTIGVHAASPAAALVADALKAGANARVEADLNNVLVLKKLAAGRYGETGCGLAALNRDVALYLMQHEGIAGLTEVGALAPVVYGVGFAKTHANALPFRDFNRALKALIKEGKIRAIVRRFGLQAPS